MNRIFLVFFGISVAFSLMGCLDDISTEPADDQDYFQCSENCKDAYYECLKTNDKIACGLKKTQCDGNCPDPEF